MIVPPYLRIDQGHLEPVTKDFIKEYLTPFMESSLDKFKHHYSSLLTLEEATERALLEAKFLLLNEEYLIAYSIQESWLSDDETLNEEFIYRVSPPSDTTLDDVVDILSVLGLLHGCVAVEVSTGAIQNKQAARRLYERSGLQESYTVMRKKLHG